MWDVLTDFSAYREWNPYMEIEGTLRVGIKLTVRMGADRGRGRAWSSGRRCQLQRVLVVFEDPATGAALWCAAPGQQTGSKRSRGAHGVMRPGAQGPQKHL